MLIGSKGLYIGQ